jgi:hypothetical protein
MAEGAIISWIEGELQEKEPRIVDKMEVEWKMMVRAHWHSRRASNTSPLRAPPRAPPHCIECAASMQYIIATLVRPESQRYLISK